MGDRSLPQGPQSSEFEEFLRHFEDSRPFEESNIHNFRQWLQNTLKRELKAAGSKGGEIEEASLLATVGTVLGGRSEESPDETTNLAERIVLDMDITSLSEAKTKSSRLEGLEEYTHHSHRESLDQGTHRAEMTPEVLEDFSDWTLGGERTNSFTEMIDTLREWHEKQPGNTRIELDRQTRTFERAFESLGGQDRYWPQENDLTEFGDLAAFDTLEWIVRTNGHDWLEPQSVEPELLKTGSGPKEGFETVTGLSLDDDRAKGWCKDLEYFVRDELGWGTAPVNEWSVVFDLESALCIYEHNRPFNFDGESDGEDGHICR